MNLDNAKNLKYRILKNNFFKIALFLTAGITIIPLLFIIIYIIINGISVIDWNFITTLPNTVGSVNGGGIAHSLLGTLILILIASLFSIPIGLGAGIYTSEHKNDRLSNLITLAVDILQGIPSIVIGIIGYIWIVRSMGYFSALAGGITLGIMMLPIIIKSTEETLKLIPYSLKEASLALGVPYYKTILKVVLPAGAGGIVTGILIGISRIAGETAPLLFTAFGNNFLNINIFKPIDALPLLIFNYATSPYEQWHKMAWGAAFILLVLILFINLSIRLAVKKWKT